MPSGIELDTRRFNAALRLYVKESKRDFAYIINKRAINIAYIAMRKTPTATAKRIERDLRKRISVPGRKGKHRPPRAALLISSGSAKAGFNHPMGLYGATMREEINRLIARRQRTRAYIKSGFLKTIRDLERVQPGRPKRQPRNTQDFSRLAGEGRGARKSINPTALIMHYAKDSSRIAGPALQAAVNADADDMVRFAKKRLIKTARKYSAK